MQTGTAVNGIDCQIFLEDAGRNMVDISGSSNNFSFDFSQLIGEYDTFGADWKQRIGSKKKDASMSLEVVYSTAVNEGFRLVESWYFNGTGGQPRRLIANIPDSNPGSYRYECEVFLESFNVAPASDSADPIMVSANLLPAGEVFRTEID